MSILLIWEENNWFFAYFYKIYLNILLVINMVSITLEEESFLDQTQFATKESLYKYIWDLLIKEKLQEAQASGSDGPFTLEESLQFLDSLMVWEK